MRKQYKNILITLLILTILSASVFLRITNQNEKPAISVAYDSASEQITVSIKSNGWNEHSVNHRYYISVWRNYNTELMQTRMDYYIDAADDGWLIYIIEDQSFLADERVTVRVQARSDSEVYSWYTYDSPAAVWTFTAE